MFERLPDAVGARPARRRARPSEAEGGLARVRAHGAEARASASSATSRSGATSRTTSSRALYDAVVYAVGAQTGRRLGIPGEDLPGSWSATELVAWYNGHPDFQEVAFDLPAERAVVVGAGNVALDVARMLALTADELAPTDTTDRAIEAIVRLGHARDRRARPPRPGPGRVHDAGAEGAGRARRRGRPRRPGRARARPGERGVARDGHERPPQHRGAARLRGARAGWQAARGPAPLRASRRSRSSATSHVEAVEIVRNQLVADEDGRVRAVATEERETIPCGVVFRSVGYLGVPLAGLPFDERSGTMPNDGGRVLGADGAPLPGVYAAGWIKRGPTGVIGTNKKDATETVALLLEDARAGRLPAPARRTPTRRSSCSPSAASSSSPTRAGRRSTPSSARPASRTAARGSSSAPGTSCWPPRGRKPRAPNDDASRALRSLGRRVAARVRRERFANPARALKRDARRCDGGAQPR